MGVGVREQEEGVGVRGRKGDGGMGRRRTEDIEEGVGQSAGEREWGGEEQVRVEPKIKEANVKRESESERRRICRNYEGGGLGKHSDGRQWAGSATGRVPMPWVEEEGDGIGWRGIKKKRRIENKTRRKRG